MPQDQSKVGNKSEYANMHLNLCFYHLCHYEVERLIVIKNNKICELQFLPVFIMIYIESLCRTVTVTRNENKKTRN